MAADDNLRARVVRALDSRVMRLILMPTEKCNFRCSYCYEDFVLGQMSGELLGAIRTLISRRAPELELLDLDWFGGEPLLAARIVEETCRYAQGLAEHHGFQFRSAMTTNGYLLDAEQLARLVAVGVRSYQVSLDGWQEVHDRTRALASGKGTFDRIWGNLLAAKRTDLRFAVSLRVHFTPANFKELPRLLREIKAALGEDRRFEVFFKAVGHYGGPNDADIDVFESSSAQRAAVAELSAHLAGGVRSTSVGAISSYVCYASQPNSLVIRSNGDVAKCTVAFADPRNKVGRLRHDGTLELDQRLLQPWFAGIETMDPATLACPLDAVSKTAWPAPPASPDKTHLRVVP